VSSMIFAVIALGLTCYTNSVDSVLNKIQIFASLCKPISTWMLRCVTNCGVLNLYVCCLTAYHYYQATIKAIAMEYAR